MDVDYDGRGGIRGRSQGREAVAAHERIMIAGMHNALMLKITLYGLASFLLIVDALLIVFAPSGRETAVNIIAVALLIIAVGSAGFATFKVKVPGIEVSGAQAATTDDEPNHTSGIGPA